MQQVNETLYGDCKSGEAKQWKVYTKGNVVTVEWGRVGGKLQTKDTICESKNVGRSNETSPEEQAVLEAESKWRKQYDKYYRPTIEEVLALNTSGVMLAQDYSKKPHFLEDSFYVSVKLDGLRVKTTFDVGGNPVWESRGNKTYPVPEQLVEELKTLRELTGFNSFDGEAYIHGIPLQSIQSCVKKPKELTKQVTYQIFDLPLEDVSWEGRWQMMVDKVIPNSESLEFIDIVDQTKISKESIPTFMKSALEVGYEGLMFRNPKGLYEFKNKRSNDLLKYKEFLDSEAKVISCTEDKNGEGVLKCIWQGVEFELKMKGTHEYRSYTNQLTLIGKWITFKYQALTVDRVPTFAVGLTVRECTPEGEPLE